MTEPTQDPRGIERLTMGILTLALAAVPFIGLIFNAPLYWYPIAAVWTWRVSEMK